MSTGPMLWPGASSAWLGDVTTHRSCKICRRSPGIEVWQHDGQDCGTQHSDPCPDKEYRPRVRSRCPQRHDDHEQWEIQEMREGWQGCRPGVLERGTQLPGRHGLSGQPEQPPEVEPGDGVALDE